MKAVFQGAFSPACKSCVLYSIVCLPLLAVGCAQPSAVAETTAAHAEPVASAESHKTGHDHSGWWCEEHGVPEAKCSLCSSKVAAECQKKGDWCQEHDRAKSQCFTCDPKAQDRFAALYRAREGKEPPPLPEEESHEGHDHDHDHETH